MLEKRAVEMQRSVSMRRVRSHEVGYHPLHHEQHMERMSKRIQFVVAAGDILDISFSTAIHPLCAIKLSLTNNSGNSFRLLPFCVTAE